MRLDRFHAEPESVGNFSCASSLGDHHQNLELPVTEFLERPSQRERDLNGGSKSREPPDENEIIRIVLRKIDHQVFADLLRDEYEGSRWTNRARDTVGIPRGLTCVRRIGENNIGGERDQHVLEGVSSLNPL